MGLDSEFRVYPFRKPLTEQAKLGPGRRIPVSGGARLDFPAPGRTLRGSFHADSYHRLPRTQDVIANQRFGR